MSQSQIIKALFHVLIFINVFLILATFRIREVDSPGADWQVLLKLGFWVLTFGLVILFMREWLPRALRVDNILLGVLLGLLGISCFYAPHLGYSLGAFFSVVTVHILFYAAASRLSDQDIVRTVFWSLVFVCICSLIIYVVVPEFGRLKEWVGSEQVMGRRMSGIVGNPNSMGFCAAFGLICAVYYRRLFARENLIVFVFCCAVILLSLALSNSRTSMLAMVMGLAIGYFAQITSGRLLLLCALISGFIILPLLIPPEEILVHFSRSGSLEEIETGTSRTHIWETAWRLIHERPLTGYGFASSNFILPQYEHEIGHAPPHTHNMALQVLFSAGYPALLTLIALLIIKLYFCFKARDYFKIALLGFLLVHGLTEAMLFRGTASLAQVALGLVFALDYRSFAVPKPTKT